jgi:hypothetical protein
MDKLKLDPRKLKSLPKISVFLSKPAHQIWFIGLIVLIISFGGHFRPNGTDFWKDTIASDGRGYYAYLPSIVLHGSSNFDQVLDREMQIYPAMMAGTFITKVDGKPVNKYFAGVALLILPFFVLAIFLSFLAGFPIDGYNAIFQMMVSVAGIFYLMLGLFFTQLLLKKFKIPDGVAVFSLWVVTFGTNLLIYTVDAPAMSHVFSFAVVAGFLLFLKEYFSFYKAKDGVLAALMFGLIVLIRPANGMVVLLIPFVAADFKRFAHGFLVFFKQSKYWLGAILAILLLVMIQPVLWFVQTGNWLVWSYQGEGFNFLSPEILKVLFSYQKGFFVYTPVALPAIFGLFVLWRKSKWQFFWMIGFLITLVWLVASWWNWYYGDSFGQRVFIDFYAVLALLLATAINGFRKKVIKTGIVTLLLILCIVNLVQTWQYSRGIIHAYAMNKAKYWHVFLKTSDDYRNLFSGPIDIPPHKTDLKTPVRVFENDFENDQEGWISSGRKAYPAAKSGNFVSELDQNQRYSSALSLTGDSLIVGRKDLYARVEAFILDKDRLASASSKLVVSLSDQFGKNYYLNAWDVNEMPPSKSDEWRRIEFGFQLPEVLNINDQMKIYLWQKGNGTLLADDFRIAIFGRKQ